MNKTTFFLALAAALLIAVSPSFAEEKHVFKFKTDSDSEAIVIEDMEVGESRQFFTDSGKEVVVTRGEDGYELSVDGREIDIHSPGDHHGLHVVEVDREEGEGEVKVHVKKVMGGHEGEGHHAIFISEDGEAHEVEGHNFVWKSDSEGEGHHAISVMVNTEGVAERVEKSGVLDELDEATRKAILKEIEKAAGHRVVHTDTKTIVIDEKEEE